MAICILATEAGLSEWVVALLELGLALGLVGFIFARMSGDVEPVLKNRDLMLIYVAGIAILWNLWFFSFWSVSIVADAAKGGFWESALTATFFGVAAIIGFPLGGWLGDREKRSAGCCSSRACSSTPCSRCGTRWRPTSCRPRP